MIKPAGAADPAHGRPSRLALYHLQRCEEGPANFDNTLAIKRNFAEALNKRHRFSSLEHLCEGARMRRGGAGAGATRVLGASQPRSGVGRGRRPHHVACVSRVSHGRARAFGHSPPVIGPSLDLPPASVRLGLLMAPPPGYFVGCRARTSRHPRINHEVRRLK
jgi:hypothetical protein